MGMSFCVVIKHLKQEELVRYIKESISYATKQNIDINLPFVENMWVYVQTMSGLITVGIVCRYPCQLSNNIESFFF